MSEREIDREHVREEHLKEVHAGAHWGYLVGVLGGGMVAMLALIAWLGGS